MRTIVMVALSTLTLFDAVGVAAEESKAETLSPGDMAWLIGTWEGEYVIPASSLDVGPPGAKVITNNTWQWGLKKGFITLGIRDMIGDKVNLVGYELLGTDQATGELAHWFYGSDGGHGSGKWTRDGKNWKLTWECSVPDKRKVSGVSMIEPVDENTYTWQMVNIKENGKAIPDWPKVTYRRTIPEADGSDFWNEYVNLVKGSWSGSGKLGADNEQFGVKRGDAFTFRLTVQPIEAAASCVCEGVLEVAEKNHRNEVRGLVGWDSATKQVHWIAFWGGGLIEELFLTRCEGNKLYGSYVVTRGDGSIENSGIVLDYSQPGTMEAKITSGQRKGETLSTWQRTAEADSPPSPAANVPALLKEYGELVVGEWECKACVPWGAAPGSGKVPARATCRWAADGAALDWDVQIGDQNAVALTWWDPVSNQLKEFGIGASGSQFELVITKDADKWKNQATMTLPDGKRVEIRTVTTFAKEGDRHVNDYTTHQDVFTRVKR